MITLWKALVAWWTWRTRMVEQMEALERRVYLLENLRDCGHVSKTAYHMASGTFCPSCQEMGRKFADPDYKVR